MTELRKIWLYDGAGVPIISDADGNLPVAIGDADGGKMTFNSRGHQEVEIASQISPAFVNHFYQLNDGWTDTTAEAVVGTHLIAVTDATAAAVGGSIIISDVLNARFLVAHVLAINTLDITVDVPIDFPYASGSDVAFASHDMNVVGSLASPVIFGIRLAEPPAALQTEITLDITRVLSTMITDGLGDLSDFGDIEGGLTNGLVLRKKYDDGTFGNILNLKTNGDLALVAYDFDRFIATNPGVGVNGQKWRLTFGSEGKMGTVIRVAAGEDLQWVVQDDLSSIISYLNMAEGALVAD